MDIVCLAISKLLFRWIVDRFALDVSTKLRTGVGFMVAFFLFMIQMIGVERRKKSIFHDLN